MYKIKTKLRYIIILMSTTLQIYNSYYIVLCDIVHVMRQKVFTIMKSDVTCSILNKTKKV